MLRRQRWHRNRLPHLHLVFANKRLKDQNQCRHWSHHCTFRTPGFLLPNTSHGPQVHGRTIAISAVRSRRATQRQESPVKNVRFNLPRDPWINTSSLSDTLAAHRQANRDGLARVGKRPIDTRHSLKNTANQRAYGPWPGLRVLRPDIAKTPQPLQIDHDASCTTMLSEWRPRQSLPTRFRFPWISKLPKQQTKGSLQSAHERLNNELEACGEYFKSTVTEQTAVERAWLDVKAIIQECLDPETGVSLIGSRASGTASPISDLDINLHVSMIQGTENCLDHASKQLRKLDRAMQRSKFRHRIVRDLYLGKANVPIISGTHVLSGLEFQIQSTTVAYDSLEVARAFVAEYPSICTLFNVVKQMLLMRGLTKSQHGGVTSYPLLNMVVASLKLSDPQIQRDDLAGQLLHFLEFWSGFDFSKYKVALVCSSTATDTIQKVNYAVDPISAILHIVPKDSKLDTNSSVMSFEDPADPSNDLGRSTYNIRHVQACFIQARESLKYAMREWDNTLLTAKDHLEQTPLLAWCLGGDYTAFEEARWQLHKYGIRPLARKV